MCWVDRPGSLSIKRSLLAESRYPVQPQQWQQPYPCLAFMSSANHVAAQPLAAWQDSPDWRLTGLSLCAGSAQQRLVREGEVCCSQLTRRWTNLRISFFISFFVFWVRYPPWRTQMGGDWDGVSARFKGGAGFPCKAEEDEVAQVIFAEIMGSGSLDQHISKRKLWLLCIGGFLGVKCKYTCKKIRRSEINNRLCHGCLPAND